MIAMFEESIFKFRCIFLRDVSKFPFRFFSSTLVFLLQSFFTPISNRFKDFLKENNPHKQPQNEELFFVVLMLQSMHKIIFHFQNSSKYSLLLSKRLLYL
nr:MAG TPA: Protein of unknown function (DUF751) [Caudoviricetes sp.]